MPIETPQLPFAAKPGSLKYKFREFVHDVEDHFPATSEGDLWFEVLLKAVEDASEWVDGRLNSFHAADAREYLRRPDIHSCSISGVDSDYIRRKLKQYGLAQHALN